MAKKVSANGTDDTAPCNKEERLHESLVRDLGGLYRDRATADLEFSVGPRGDRIKAHRLIVQCRCEKYRNKWAGEQGTVSVRLERTDVRSFKSVLRYIYTGKVMIMAELPHELVIFADDVNAESKLLSKDKGIKIEGVNLG